MSKTARNKPVNNHQMVRLNKYLADCGVGSRRKCDQLILQGKVSVNGVVETRLGVQIDVTADSVMFENQPLTGVQRFEYYLLNKPKGVLTTARDERGRTTVVDLIRTRARIYPVGRLDKDTTGLLLLTNDGLLAYRLMHPKFGVEKIYEVTLDKPLAEPDRKQLQAGIELEEGVTSESRIDYLLPGDRKRLQITIHQGWKRQIRRMFAARGYEVRTLTRTGIGFLRLENLRPGDCRELTKREIAQLKKLVGDARGN